MPCCHEWVSESAWDEAEPLKEMARKVKPGDRWPYEPPAGEPGPDAGVREPRRPKPADDEDALEAGIPEEH